MNPTSPDALADLIEQLDTAVLETDAERRSEAVKRAIQALTGRPGALDPALLEPVAEGYGRRLLHRDPDGRYSVVVMTWGPGQGTPIHDHAGLWCVECVYRGVIRVDSYRLAEDRPDGRVRFELEKQIQAGVGEAGALIPPFDHHVIANDHAAPAATVHVYGGEMHTCAVFEPDGGADGGFRRRQRELSYDNA